MSFKNYLKFLYNKVLYVVVLHATLFQIKMMHEIYINKILLQGGSYVACNTTTNEISLCNTNDNIYFSKISPKSDTLSVIIRSYKSAVTKKIHDLGLINFQWQKLFYDHIIRNENSLCKINNYIKYNYLKWKEDEYYNN